MSQGPVERPNSLTGAYAVSNIWSDKIPLRRRHIQNDVLLSVRVFEIHGAVNRRENKTLHKK